MSTKNNLIDLFKSGNFSIIYTDNTCCTIYEGHVDTNSDLNKAKEIVSFDCDSEGYLPAEVSLLVKALGGKSDSF